jgi:hypothetical protein
MIPWRKPLIVAAASLAVLLVVGVLVQRVGATGAQSAGHQGGFAPCPASWYPLEKQPAAIQFACIHRKEQALLDERATAQALPWRPSNPPTPDLQYNYTPGPEQGVVPGDWLATKAIREYDVFQGAHDHLPDITSIWQVGVILSPDHRGFGRVIVYAAGPDGQNIPDPVIERRIRPEGRFQPGALGHETGWQTRQNIGALTITGITGPTGVVSFTAASGVSGTLNMATGAWTFNQ